MEAKVIANPCDTCVKLNCNTCKNELLQKDYNITVTRLPIDPYIGFNFRVSGAKKIKGNDDHVIKIGNVTSKPGGYILAVGPDKGYNAISVTYMGSNIWRAYDLVGLWEVETE